VAIAHPEQPGRPGKWVVFVPGQLIELEQRQLQHEPVLVEHESFVIQHEPEFDKPDQSVDELEHQSFGQQRDLCIQLGFDGTAAHVHPERRQIETAIRSVV